MPRVTVIGLDAILCSGYVRSGSAWEQGGLGWGGFRGGCETRVHHCPMVEAGGCRCAASHGTFGASYCDKIVSGLGMGQIGYDGRLFYRLEACQSQRGAEVVGLAP